MCVRRGQGWQKENKSKKAAETDKNKTEQNTIYQEGKEAVSPQPDIKE